MIASAGLFPNEVVRRRHACSLGISVVSRAHGQGVGTTLMARLAEFADKWTTYLRIELTVFSDNKAAISLYERFGFQREGVHRGYGLRHGRFQDVITMARLHPDLPRLAVEA